MPNIAKLCADLAEEQAELDRFLIELGPDQWSTLTPAPGWTVQHQVAHLEFFDGAAIRAASDPDAFALDLAAETKDADAYHRNGLQAGLALAPGQLLDRWRERRKRFQQVFRTLDPAIRVPWFGPPMSVASKVTARLMETWAHGQDVVDTFGFARQPTARLRHVAHIGVRARAYSYLNRSRDVPDEDVRVDLAAPDGERWTWGDPETEHRVEGPALDFCLVVTRRRHLDDTRLVVSGAAAEDWLSIAQSFAGDPGTGREAGQFPRA